MNQAEKLMHRYEVGFPTFRKLFALNKEDLKAKLLSILKNKFDTNSNLERLITDGGVTKIIENDIPQKIKIEFYDTLFIEPTGIYLKPEMHGGHTEIITFDENFHLNENGMESSIAKLRNMLGPVANFFAYGILNLPDEIREDEKFDQALHAYHKSITFIKDDNNWQ